MKVTKAFKNCEIVMNQKVLGVSLPLGRTGVLIMSCGIFVSVEGSQLRSQGSKPVEGKTSTQFSG